MHKELSTTKARAQRDIEELREHLRLVYKALETSSVDEHLDAGDNNWTLYIPKYREKGEEMERDFTQTPFTKCAALNMGYFHESVVSSQSNTWIFDDLVTAGSLALRSFWELMKLRHLPETIQSTFFEVDVSLILSEFKSGTRLLIGILTIDWGCFLCKVFCHRFLIYIYTEVIVSTVLIP